MDGYPMDTCANIAVSSELMAILSVARDLKDLRAWKQEELDRAAESRKGIQERQDADARAPLVATMTARWPDARELHDVELVLDFRAAVPTRPGGVVLTVRASHGICRRTDGRQY